MATIMISGYEVLVDDEDLDRINKYNWYISRKSGGTSNFYFITQGRHFPCKTGTVQLHRFIAGCTRGDGITVDHINRNSLDNRKCNLRKTSPSINAHNRVYKRKKKYIGTTYRKEREHYFSAITFNNVQYYLGSSTSEEECARWYDMAVLYFNDIYADTNFPRETYTEDDIASTQARLIDIKSTKNTTGYVGVSFDKKLQKYRSAVSYKGVHYWLGSYNSPEEAALARDRQAYRLLGDKARLNFPDRIAEYKKESSK